MASTQSLDQLRTSSSTWRMSPVSRPAPARALRSPHSPVTLCSTHVNLNLYYPQELINLSFIYKNYSNQEAMLSTDEPERETNDLGLGLWILCSDWRWCWRLLIWRFPNSFWKSRSLYSCSKFAASPLSCNFTMVATGINAEGVMSDGVHIHTGLITTDTCKRLSVFFIFLNLQNLTKKLVSIF